MEGESHGCKFFKDSLYIFSLICNSCAFIPSEAMVNVNFSMQCFLTFLQLTLNVM